MKLKLATAWLAVILLGGMLFGIMSLSNPVAIIAAPEVPKRGQPVMVDYTLNNPSSQSTRMHYEFYVNGELLKTGTTEIGPNERKTYKYVYDGPVDLGRQINFLLKTDSGNGPREYVVSLPAYPPQVLSSFISFASFSTSVMTSMSTMTYYESSFTFRRATTISGIIAAVLVIILIFLEITLPRFAERTVGIFGKLRLRLGMLSWVLFTIFFCIILTDAVLIISA